MALTPVVAGACLAWSDEAPVRPVVFALTLACALLIQAATNLLNDVADHEKGNDGADRVGPLRITAAGRARLDCRRLGLFGWHASRLVSPER